MNRRKVEAGFRKIKKAFPTAQMSNSYDTILIPQVMLPRKFNLPYTPLLIKVHSFADYTRPDGYVDRDLKVYGEQSMHLDEALTEDWALENGWVKICLKRAGGEQEWHPSFNVDDFVIVCLNFLKDLRD